VQLASDCEYLGLEGCDGEAKFRIVRQKTCNHTMQNSERVLPGIDVLNTGYGDFTLQFDPDKPDEIQKAKETRTSELS
jgi:hypothetical protein